MLTVFLVGQCSRKYTNSTDFGEINVELQLLARLWHDVEIRFSRIVEIPDRLSAVSLSSTRHNLFV